MSLHCRSLAQREGGGYPGRVLFENINIEWPSPSIQVIMGASGKGKSTLMKTLGGVWPPEHGSVSIGERNLWNESKTLQNQDLLRDIGFAFQNNALFSSMNNLENLCFPYQKRFPESSREDRMNLGQSWLEIVNLKDAGSRYPHELSGGMQKRLAIARTLMLDPKYIFLDDPTAGLDPITSREIASLVNSLLDGKDALVVIVTNDPERAIDWGPNVHYLHDGELHLYGSKDWERIARIYS